MEGDVDITSIYLTYIQNNELYYLETIVTRHTSLSLLSFPYKYLSTILLERKKKDPILITIVSLTENNNNNKQYNKQ